MAAVARLQAVPPPSQFASLLRRSKFASYDPQTGQVFASYDGDAHRGNWGLKRPLPLRRRTAHITISAIDSKEQQTEWKHADNEARWMKMWDEVGIHPTNDVHAPWTTRLGGSGLTQYGFDSEFAQNPSARPATREVRLLEGGEEEQKAGRAAATQAGSGSSSAIPNIEAMSRKQFETYLKRMRELHPEFAEYVREVAARNTDKRPKASTLWELATSGSLEVHHSKFLGNQAYKLYNAPDSRAIEQQPSRAAGLSYTQTSLLQSFLYKKARKGRLLANAVAGQPRIAGFAGTNVYLAWELRGPGSTVNWDSLAKTGTYNPSVGAATYRYTKAELGDAPTVVGPEKQGLEGLRMEGFVADMSSNALAMGRANPHTPGSKAYVGCIEDTPQPANLLAKQSLEAIEKQQQPAADSTRLLSTLGTLLHDKQL